MQMKSFQKILTIIFQHFTVLMLQPDLSQLKQNLISSIVDFVHKLLHKLSNNLSSRKLNDKKKLKLCEDTN